MRIKLFVAFVFAMRLSAQAPESQKAESMLGAALHLERVTGNLRAAIDGYRKVLASKGVSRSVAAQAQYHIGVCHEKLGSEEARKAFENVVNNYADQKDLAGHGPESLRQSQGASGYRHVHVDRTRGRHVLHLDDIEAPRRAAARHRIDDDEPVAGRQ